MSIQRGVARLVAFGSVTTAGVANTATIPTVVIDKDGAGQLPATNAPTSQGNGSWKILLTAAEMGADLVALTATGSGLVPAFREIYTEADFTPTRAGFLDASINTRSTYNGSDTAGTLTLLTRLPSALSITAGKVAATVAAGDNVDSAAIRTTIGVAGAGLTAIPYTGPTDYQQRGVAVTLPAGGVTVANASVSSIAGATALIVTPSGYGIATDSLGKVTTSNPATGGVDPTALANSLAARIATDHGTGSYQTATSVSVSDKTGFSLAAGSITSTTFGAISAGVNGFLERLALMVASRYPVAGGSVTFPHSGNGQTVTRGAGGAVLATQAVSDDGTTQTLGGAS